MNIPTFTNRKYIVLTLIICFSFFYAIDARNLLMDYIDSEAQEINKAYADEKQRNLQTISNPHGLRIKYDYQYYDFNQSYYNSTSWSVINNRFNTVAFYLKQIIKVTDVNESNILKYGCANSSSNGIYNTSGYSYDEADTIIFLFFSNVANTYPFQGQHCQLGAWVQYGYIFSYSQSAPWSLNIQEAMNFLIRTHIHVLAFNYQLARLYKKSYMSSVVVSSCQVFATHNNNTFIITPNVKAYVQKFFNCDQSSLGARAIIVVGGFYHWSQEQFYDEILSNIYTVGYLYSKVYMTELTLNLLKDTGFFYDVDLSYAEYTSYGKNKGCDFARGYNTTYNIQPQYCTNTTMNTSSSYVLDYYRRSLNAVCKKPLRPYFYTNSSVYCTNTQQRTFLIQQNSVYAIKCYNVTCFNDNLNINVTINSTIAVTCSPKLSVNISSTFTLFCPGYPNMSLTNFDAMCNRKYCGTQCQSYGICNHGSCVSQTLCSTIDPNCVKCKGTTCTGCISGFFPTPPNSISICEICQNILPSCSNGCQVTNEGVTICKVIQQTVSINGTCSTCIAVRYCLTCNTINSNRTLFSGTFCLTCANDTQGNKRYPTSDQQSCVYCSYFIQNCILCNVTLGVANCLACSTGLYPDPTYKTCVPCSYYIDSCIQCNVTIGVAKCITCAVGKYPDILNDYCYTCSQFIMNCTTCVVNAGVANCSVCDKYFTPDSTGAYCIFCKNFISNCSTCANSTFCLECDTGLYTTGSSCKVCRQLFTNCTECFAANEQSAVCTSCDPDLFTIGGDCKVCWQLFDNCTSCTVSSNGMTVCLNCQSSLYTVGENCKPCNYFISNCTKCSTNAKGIAFCSECDTGLYTVGGNCSACEQLFINCTNCTVNNLGLAHCVDCVPTFQPNMNGSACRSVFCVTKNCHLCYNETNSSGTVQKCQECLDSFYLVQSSNKCQKCRQGCATCSERNRCGICIDGYFRIAKGCYPCPRQCTKCQTKKGCFQSFGVVCI